MTVTGKASRYPRTFGLPWVSEVPQQVSQVGISAPVPLELARDPALSVAANFTAQRGGNSASVCQADWRVAGVGSNPVLPEYFQGGVLPSGQVFFPAGAVEVPASFLLSPGADPPSELAGQVVLENLVNCEIAAGRGELPFRIQAAEIGVGDAIVALEVPFSVIDPGGTVPTGDYTYELDLAAHRRIASSDGADLWPVTWASSNVYTMFGDGPTGAGSVSLGLARFTGSTLAGLDIDYIVGGPSPSAHDKFNPIAGWPTQDGGLHAKCTSLIALGSSLYLWIVQGGSNPAGWADCRVGRVALGGALDVIDVPSWGMGQDHAWKTINPAWLQCGQNFGTAFDEYVYAFPQHYAPVDNQPGDSPSHNPGRFYLLRCLRSADWQAQSNWQWWTGGADDAPTWGAYADRQARITMSGQIDWRPSAFYLQAPVDLCLFRIGRTGNPDYGGGSMSRFATFTAQRPWHAWTMIADKQYTATGIDPDLAQVSPIPSTLVIDGAGVATWIDATWGGDNTDQCILAPSTLTPVP